MSILALERSGQSLDRVERAFFHLVGTASGDEIEAIQREIQPRLAREYSEMLLDDALFARVEAVHARVAGLDPEAARLVERRWLAFKRAGAGLPAAAKQRLAESPNGWRGSARASRRMCWATKRPLRWCWSRPPISRACRPLRSPPPRGRRGARPSRGRGRSRCHAPPSSRSCILGAARPARKIWRVFVDPRRSASATMRRDERDGGAARRLARLLGYASFADYKLADTMARAPAAALDLMDRVWAPARAAAREEAKALQAMIAEDGGNFELKPWDWRYYAEKRRQALYDFDEARSAPICRSRTSSPPPSTSPAACSGPFLRGAVRRRLAASRRARLRGEGRERPSCRVVHRRFLRTAGETQRRLDVGVAR